MVASGDDDVLTAANDIDDFDRTTGQGFNAAADQFVAFLATPVGN